MEIEKKIKELAETLKNSGLAASMEDALSRAKDILTVKKPQATAESPKEEPANEETQERTLKELMDEDASEIYSNEKAETSNETKEETIVSKVPPIENSPSPEIMQKTGANSSLYEPDKTLSAESTKEIKKDLEEIKEEITELETAPPLEKTANPLSTEPIVEEEQTTVSKDVENLADVETITVEGETPSESIAEETPPFFEESTEDKKETPKDDQPEERGTKENLVNEAETPREPEPTKEEPLPEPEPPLTTTEPPLTTTEPTKEEPLPEPEPPFTTTEPPLTTTEPTKESEDPKPVREESQPQVEEMDTPPPPSEEFVVKTNEELDEDKEKDSL